ncbi:apicoplast TIC22 protein [Plasmodium gonderi]|uniref:Apicoplast TIC22 protein n=1 Tax=Plasmodium gonderi TaxID=77519 RepID=A0A1Y1JJ95_PLAGO|nr:apicoplast TIC22 protein [Plasmodium gonderi]GAW81267.1 apicoplast TIC22 protein [Plasmodium gonderi]
MYLIIFLCIYMLNILKCLNTNAGIQRSINILVPNERIWKKMKYESKLCMLRNKINFQFWKKKYHERSIDEKLKIIPVYILTNHNNSPYIFHENDKQVCYLFLCPYDAENMLNEIINNNGVKNTNNIKIHHINMQKAYELINEFLRLKNIENVHAHVKKNNVYWKLMPSSRQIQNALLFLSFKKKSEIVFPIFYIEGFYLQRDAKNIVPLFFDMEDLKIAIEKTPMKNYKIKVLNFVDLIFSDDNKKFGFIPSSTSLAYVDKLKKIVLRKSYF